MVASNMSVFIMYITLVFEGVQKHCSYFIIIIIYILLRQSKYSIKVQYPVYVFAKTI